ncbi:FAD-binding oxidoreductase [Rubrivirga sp. IMCC45206]|uniref:FAD-binding oxidoreductase n=1 Tax=Rubrivirga sp. IMCC45206 TaxID=3391614 RepID=UPI00398FF606
MDAPPKGYLAATVERRLDVVDDLAVFWLRPPQPLTFRPGQYVTLAAPDASGRVVKRAYSVVSAPHEPLVELVIELVDEGELTPLLWPLRPGDTVWVRKKVVGHFLLDAERTRHVMACTVTGIAPFLSMIRAHAAAQGAGETVPDHRFLVVHGASHAAEFGPYLDELAALAEADWVEAVSTVSRPWSDLDWAGETGRVEDVLRKHLDRLAWAPDAVAGYACGNPQMIETVRGILARARVDDAHVHEEKYFTVGEAGTLAEAPTPAPAAAFKRPPVLPGRRPGSVVLKTAPRPPKSNA